MDHGCGRGGWIPLAFRLIIWGVAFAIPIAGSGCSVAQVEGFSMAPTLENRDYLVVDRLAYDLGDPQRGDIVMLSFPRARRSMAVAAAAVPDTDMRLVKRVVAVAGDLVEIVDGRVRIDGCPAADVDVPPAFRSHDHWGPERIPSGYYFVMGDHRNRSSDSRQWGMVPRRDILGRIAARWWPIRTMRTF